MSIVNDIRKDPTVSIEHEVDDVYMITDIENWELTEDDPNRIYLYKWQLQELLLLLEKKLPNLE